MAEMLKELEVLNNVASALDALEKDEQRRVVLWLADYFDVYEDGLFDYDGLTDFSFDDADFSGAALGASGANSNDDHTWKSLYARVAPHTAIQKIATAGYWLETKEDHDSWKSFETNKLLKELDVKVSSVSGTLALDAKKDDPMTETLSKSGDSMQARKTFRLSDSGRAWVENRL